MIERLGGEVVGTCFLIELADLNARIIVDLINDVYSLLEY